MLDLGRHLASHTAQNLFLIVGVVIKMMMTLLMMMMVLLMMMVMVMMMVLMVVILIIMKTHLQPSSLLVCHAVEL